MVGERSLRQLVKCLLAGATHSFGLWKLLRARAGNEVLVLGLHRVVTADQRARAHSLPGMFMDAENFRALLQHLKVRFEILTLDMFLSGNFPEARKPLCLLTFDDGWEDNFTTAYPLLKEHAVPAAIFLATGVMDEGGVFWVERLLQAVQRHGWSEIRSRLVAAAGKPEVGPDAEAAVEFLKHMPAQRREQILAPVLADAGCADRNGDSMMTWDQVQTMSREGIPFGAHTVTHPLLTYEEPADVERELTAAKAKIESVLGRPVEAFAYPNGDWNPAVRQAVEAVGYRCAFQVRRGWHSPGDDIFSIRRVFIHDGAVAGWNGEFSPAVFHWTVNR
ncbi:MAG: polysaccharide deacetylase family protein [Terriglobales bacterium]